MRKNKKGFTLIEMIVVVGIFSTVVLIAVALYLNVTSTQKRIVSLQKIQEDIRFAMESMAQSIRLSKINYQYYVTNSIDLYPGGQVDILALKDQADKSVFFRKNIGADNITRLQYCSTIDVACLDTDWQVVTPAEVNIEQLQFFITPSADPFNAPTGLPSDCSMNPPSCPAGYQCVGTACKYYHDGNNFQPKVRVIMATKGVGVQKESASIKVQTTVTSRIIPSKVFNQNY